MDCVMILQGLLGSITIRNARLIEFPTSVDAKETSAELWRIFVSINWQTPNRRSPWTATLIPNRQEEKLQSA